VSAPAPTRQRPDGQEQFLANRPMLHALAYRMLGSVHDAEDVVQDAYLRWAAQDAETIENPAAFLTTVATRLCLDRLRSAAAKREVYVGPWLPEPLPTGTTGSSKYTDPASTVALRESASIGMLLLLERLSPAERAVFVLREAFDVPYPQIADIVDYSPESCRQLHRRARQKVSSTTKRSRTADRPADPVRDRRLVESFLAAAEGGDLESLKALFREDVVVLTDGGGKVSAARNPIYGMQNAARLYAKVFPRRFVGSKITYTSYNHAPALLVERPRVTFAYIFDIDDEGLIANIYMIANPDKLTHLKPAA